MQAVVVKAVVAKPKNEPQMRTKVVKSKLKNESPQPPSFGMKQQQDEWMLTNAWKITFLSTLTHALYMSEKPFEDFKLNSSEFLKTMQTIFDLVFPHITYSLSSSDELVKKVPFMLLSLPSY
jgi:hypothetical protein